MMWIFSISRWTEVFVDFCRDVWLGWFWVVISPWRLNLHLVSDDSEHLTFLSFIRSQFSGSHRVTKPDGGIRSDDPSPSTCHMFFYVLSRQLSPEGRAAPWPQEHVQLMVSASSSSILITWEPAGEAAELPWSSSSFSPRSACLLPPPHTANAERQTVRAFRLSPRSPALRCRLYF